MRSVKSLLGLVLSGAIGLFGAAEFLRAQTTFTHVVDRANRGVAAIVKTGEYGIGVPVGTAFFITQDHLVTNAHVIRDAEKAGSFGVYFPSFVPNTNRVGGMDVVEVELVEVDDDYDLAILKVKNQLRRVPNPFRLAVGSVPIGTELALTGYGALSDFPITVTAFAASGPSHHFGSGLPQQMQKVSQVFGIGSFFVIDKPIVGGLSGSPVYLRESGIAYGIASATLSDGMAGVGLVRPFKRLATILERHRIQYTPAKPLDSFVNP